MIIENGTICFLSHEDATTTDSLGYIQRAKEQWSDPVPCHIRQTQENRTVTHGDGRLTEQHYTVIVPEEYFHRAIKRVKLILQGKPIGAFDVIGLTLMNVVHKAKIRV